VTGYYRVVVTGSRNWTDRAKLFAKLEEVRSRLPDGTWLIVRHGGAGGTDGLAHSWAERAAGVLVERRRADWRAPCRDTCRPGHRLPGRDGASYCPAAGMYRNEAMLTGDGPVDEVLAFVMPCGRPRHRHQPPHDSHGTAGMIGLAGEAGVPVDVTRP